MTQPGVNLVFSAQDISLADILKLIDMGKRFKIVDKTEENEEYLINVEEYINGND